MLEIMSPAGAPEGVVAAIQNGADAVYLGFSEFNACPDAENFTFDEFGRALEYCRIRGVKAYLTLNTLALDRELPVIAHQVKEASRYGVDAVIVQDFGVMSAVKDAVPGLPLHASTHMGIHNLEGVKMAAAMGFSRVILARQLSRKKISHICRYSPIEIGIFIHGNLCMGYSGQCYMSALTGSQSSNRGQCSEPCQRDYSTAGHTITYPLSLKDNCLVRYLAELDSIGITGVRIEGQDKRPEYSAIVSGIYSKVAHRGKTSKQDDLRAIMKAFSRHGLTDGFYADRLGPDMFGACEEDEKSDSVMFATARKNYLNGEYQRVPVRFVGTIMTDKRVKIAAMDDRKNTAVVFGPVPEPAFHKDLTVAVLQTQLHKTGGTPFQCMGVKGKVERGLALPISAFDDMRQSLLSDLLEQRKPAPERDEGLFVPSDHVPGYEEPPILTVSVLKVDQLSEELEELCPKLVYIPLVEMDSESPVLRSFLDNKDITVVAVLPRVIHDNERKSVAEMLTGATALGVTDTLVNNIGHIQFARSHGTTVRGDFGMNVFNSETLSVLRAIGLKSVTLSIEMHLNDIRDLSKPIDTELIVYGRLPLMITENCIVKNTTGACTCDSFSGLVDSNGSLLPVVPEFGCRNVLLSSKKLFLADRRRSTSTIGLWAERLNFTTENALECVAVMKRYMGEGDYVPSGYSRGLYYRGVE